MTNQLAFAESLTEELSKLNVSESTESADEGLHLDRRSFLQLLGSGLLISTTCGTALAQRGRGGGGGGARTVAARLHIAKDGTITVLTGKVEVGQGSRAQLTQAAAEELRVDVEQVRLIMADTAQVPDDGITAGSRTTPSTVPSVRRGAAAARELLVQVACRRWSVDQKEVEVRDGAVRHEAKKLTLTYAELAQTDDVARAFQQAIPDDVAVTPVAEWKVLGRSVPRPNRRDIVSGAHRYPSDIVRPEMLHGKILRPPSYGATLREIDLSPAQAMQGVVVVREGGFVGCAAPTSWQAQQAIEAVAKTAAWDTAPHPSNSEVFSYLKQRARSGGGSGRDRGPGPRDSGEGTRGSGADSPATVDRTLRATYEVAYVQHAPLETRAAVAEWNGDQLTVWTGSQAPTRVRQELAEGFRISASQVRVIIPDTGGGFGGKHGGDAAVEAARLARAAKRPVSLHWSREEEFMWAYFRPAALIEVQAALSADGKLTAWDFTNINSGSAAVDTPYAIPGARSRSVSSDSPLRQGSYRCLAATANNFARESFMDELAVAAGIDPLAFRLAHLKDDRLRAVLETAAREFQFSRRSQERKPDIGVGLACGTEKGSYVAACVEVRVDREHGRIEVVRVCEAFECGAIQNPDNLRAQVEGCILMGLGPALWEEMRFENGKILNGNFRDYRVPRFRDVPQLDVHLLNRPDLASAGGGETPIIAVAPAIANAVFHATGTRIRSMPIRGDLLRRTSS